MGWTDDAHDAVAALVRIADALDRAVFLGEAWSAQLGVVAPEAVDIDLGQEEETEK